MARRDHVMSYRVFRVGCLCSWEVVSLGQCIGSGLQPTLVKARAQAVLFAIATLEKLETGGTARTR
jgi:hypothetical protein